MKITSTNPSCASVLHSQYGKFIMKHLSVVGKTSGCRRHSSSCSDSYQLTINVSAPVCPFPRVSVRRSLFLLTPSWARMEIAVPPVLGVLVDFQVRAAFHRDSITFCSRILTCRRGGVGGINPAYLHNTSGNTSCRLRLHWEIIPTAGKLGAYKNTLLQQHTLYFSIPPRLPESRFKDSERETLGEQRRALGDEYCVQSHNVGNSRFLVGQRLSCTVGVV